MRTLTVALASLLCVATGLIGEDAPAVPPPAPAPAPEKTVPAADAVKPADVEKRLDAIIIPKFDFRQVTATEIVKFLDSYVTTLGGEVEKKDETRVKIVADFGKGGDTLPLMTFAGKKMPLLYAVKLACKNAGLEYKISGLTVTISPAK